MFVATERMVWSICFANSTLKISILVVDDEYSKMISEKMKLLEDMENHEAQLKSRRFQ